MDQEERKNKPSNKDKGPESQNPRQPQTHHDNKYDDRGKYDDRSRHDDAARQKLDELFAKLKAEDFYFDKIEVKDFAYEGGYADALARSMRKDSMKAHQLRKFFTEIGQIERDASSSENMEKEPEAPLSEQIGEKIALVMPELAYAKGRELISHEFYDVMKLSLRNTKTFGDFRKFKNFLTAVVAYSKLRGVLKE